MIHPPTTAPLARFQQFLLPWIFSSVSWAVFPPSRGDDSLSGHCWAKALSAAQAGRGCGMVWLHCQSCAGTACAWCMVTDGAPELMKHLGKSQWCAHMGTPTWTA